MPDTLVRELQLYRHEDGGVLEKAASGHALPTADVSSSSLSAVDFCASDLEWGSSAHTTSMDRSLNPIDTVSLESFPWADLSIFQDEEMDAKGIDLDALGTLPLDVTPAAAAEARRDTTSDEERMSMQRSSRSKRPRGPKPKYVYSDPEQAAAARRERNRAAALQSYYKKKNHTANLEQQVRELEQENNKLMLLLEKVENGSLTIQHEGELDQHVSEMHC